MRAPPSVKEQLSALLVPLVASQGDAAPPWTGAFYFPREKYFLFSGNMKPDYMSPLMECIDLILFTGPVLTAHAGDMLREMLLDPKDITPLYQIERLAGSNDFWNELHNVAATLQDDFEKAHDLIWVLVCDNAETYKVFGNTSIHSVEQASTIYFVKTIMDHIKPDLPRVDMSNISTQLEHSMDVEAPQLLRMIQAWWGE